MGYRPWTLIHEESFDNKEEAIQREKFFKSGRGREIVTQITLKYLSENVNVRYPPEAEKD